MGVEFSYCVIPDDSVILKKAKVNPKYADCFIYGPSYGWWPGESDPIYDEFEKDSYELIREHPDIEKRRCTVDRCWDVLHFLLSEERRKGNHDETDLGTIAVYGATTATCLAHGWPRYTPPEQVKSVILFLNSISQSELLRWADPKELENCYKGPYPPDQITFFFNELRDFYRVAWLRHEGVLVIKN